MNEVTKRIICTANLVSPHFRVTSESREVAMRLYPIRLPVSQMITSATFFDGRRVDDSVETDVSQYPHQGGAVYINTELDIFALCVDRLGGWHMLNSYYHKPPYGGANNFGWRSPSLSPLQCASLQRLMVFDCIFSPNVFKCFQLPPKCLFKYDATQYSKRSGGRRWWQRTVFSGIRKIMYVVCNLTVVAPLDMYESLLKRPGREIIRDLERRSWLADFDAVEFVKCIKDR
ncbi:hypothetical protein F5Y16DRAFT_421211 [Xylariaceae sp. FL0255]|nr:hypothetical protein F5Y16DRAFT_421211 [Xylariaceae sp. FL0255]